MLPEDKLQKLLDDIQEHGLREPITLTNETPPRVLDGRNRLAALTRIVPEGPEGKMLTRLIEEEGAYADRRRYR